MALQAGGLRLVTFEPLRFTGDAPCRGSVDQPAEEGMMTPRESQHTIPALGLLGSIDGRWRRDGVVGRWLRWAGSWLFVRGGRLGDGVARGRI